MNILLLNYYVWGVPIRVYNSRKNETVCNRVKVMGRDPMINTSYGGGGEDS